MPSHSEREASRLSGVGFSGENPCRSVTLLLGGVTEKLSTVEGRAARVRVGFDGLEPLTG